MYLDLDIGVFLVGNYMFSSENPEITTRNNGKFRLREVKPEENKSERYAADEHCHT